MVNLLSLLHLSKNRDQKLIIDFRVADEDIQSSTLLDLSMKTFSRVSAELLHRKDKETTGKEMREATYIVLKKQNSVRKFSELLNI